MENIPEMAFKGIHHVLTDGVVTIMIGSSECLTYG